MSETQLALPQSAFFSSVEHDGESFSLRVSRENHYIVDLVLADGVENPTSISSVPVPGIDVVSGVDVGNWGPRSTHNTPSRIREDLQTICWPKTFQVALLFCDACMLL